MSQLPSKSSEHARPAPASPVKLLAGQTFTEEERERLIGYVLDLKKSHIQQFLFEQGLPTSGTKAQLRERLEAQLQTGSLTSEELVSLVDSIEPWGKQHVVLYDGPDIDLAPWKDERAFLDRLKQHRLSRYYNARLPLILPQSLALSSVEHSSRRLRITAIERRDYWERLEDLDRHERDNSGDEIELRAFAHRVSRGIVAWEWDLVSNTAFLQITELPSHSKFEKVIEKFHGMVGRWLEIGKFPQVDLSRSIGRFHELELLHTAETRSHGIDYATLTGRRLSGRSASSLDPLIGEVVVDSALDNVRKAGVGHSGNFYFVPTSRAGNPIKDEVHVVVMADKGRLHLMAANEEKVVRYVLHRIRAACR